MHNTPTKSPIIKYMEFFTSMLFLHCKICTWRTQRKCDMICCRPIPQVGFQIWPKPALSLTGLVQGKQGELVCMDPPSMSLMQTGTTAWHLQSKTHTHIQDKHQQVKVNYLCTYQKNAQFRHMLHMMNQSPSHSTHSLRLQLIYM